jgi:hypothetical protein
VIARVPECRLQSPEKLKKYTLTELNKDSAQTQGREFLTAKIQQDEAELLQACNTLFNERKATPPARTFESVWEV